MGGRFVLHLDADANQTPACSRIEMTLTDLQLAQMPHKAEPPPYEGSLQLQIHAQGGAFTQPSVVRLFVHRQRKPVLAELFPLSFAGIPGDLMTTPRTQEQFVAIRECGCNHC
jgi:hypothetical protein